MPHFENPKSDNERLLNYQYEYIVNGSEKAWTELWVLSLKTAERILANQCTLRKLHLSKSEWEDKISEAVEYVLRRYKTTEGYFIEKGFVLQLWYGVKHALDYRTKADVLFDNTIKKLNTGELKLK